MSQERGERRNDKRKHHGDPRSYEGLRPDYEGHRVRPGRGKPRHGVTKRHKVFALIGNPNVGKTTLFNELTGANQHVGNWPGVTVAKKEGHVKSIYGEAIIVDLPGTYSLSPDSLEEVVSRNFIEQEHPDCVIDIVDATTLERNLYLTFELAETGVPVVVALNMMDELEAEGTTIDVEKLSERIGLPVIPITAARGEGIAELIAAAESAPEPDASSAVRERDILACANASACAGCDSCKERRRHYAFIADTVGLCVHSKRSLGEPTLSDRIDAVVTNRWAGVPIFLLIMFLMFHLTFSSSLLGTPLPSPGVWLQSLINGLFSWLSDTLTSALGEGTWLQSLVVKGVLGGIGGVLSFVPQIVLMFFFLSLLEDCGYMARAAYVMDRFFRRFGLSGKSFMPMLMGFGCNVPAVMACRTMENVEDRNATLMIIPFMSCGARAPIFLCLAGAFFPQQADLILFGLYFLGIVVALLSGILLRKLVFKGKVSPFAIELPPYRSPRWKSVGLELWEKFRDYLQRAGTIIFAMSIVIWLLSSFNFQFQMCPLSESILAVVGGWITPIFTPLGFGTWAAAIALLTGMIAKESVVGTLGVLANMDASVATERGISHGALVAMGFTPLSSLSFMVFTLLYLPCMATLATLRTEFGSWKWTFLQVGWALVCAYLCSLLVYAVGSLMGVA